ncbi:MAG: hypothetical protein C4519_15755 [Desulfobacteraceae bacterium]|nr:MAG: hypothetical protein C4519_15755 [Desulfobacteraceae bacterium]
MGYFLDERCGVHHLVDQEFEHNRQSTLKCLENSRYGGVRSAFENAYSHFDSQPQDTKVAVRSIFEALEILTKLMAKTDKLNKSAVENMLEPLALRQCGTDETARRAVHKMFLGFAEWVDAIHFYRHGQGQSEPVAPSIDFAVYALSSGTGFLRWLLTIDSNELNAGS